MENDRILEIDLQIKELKDSHNEVYGWILLKEKQRVLTQMLNSNNPLENCDGSWEELGKVESEILSMKKKYSSLMLYDALISVKQKMMSKCEEIDRK